MFSFKRFSEQFKIIILQNSRRQGMYLLCISLLLIINNFKSFYFEEFNNESLLASAKFIIVVMAIINSIEVFGKLRKPDSGIHYMMMPATIAEKYFAAWVYSTLFTFTLYTTALYLIHSLSMMVGNLITGLDWPYIYISLKDFYHLFLGTMFIQSLYFLGSIVFRKSPFAKTTAMLFGGGILISIVMGYILRHFMNGMMVENGHSITINGDLSMNTINGIPLPESLDQYVTFAKILFGTIPFICWFATYFRLKKLEI